jgi:peroxiredoxin Q/BCP
MKNIEKFELPEIGKKAPELNLINDEGEKIKLKDFKGKNLVLYFYPKALTPGCTVQACGITDTKKQFEKLNTVIVGVSADPQKKLNQFREKYKLNFILASDQDLETAKAYGSFGLKKFMGREYMGILRQTFIIDTSGKLRHIMEKVNTKTHHDDVIKIIKTL